MSKDLPEYPVSRPFRHVVHETLRLLKSKIEDNNDNPPCNYLDGEDKPACLLGQIFMNLFASKWLVNFLRANNETDIQHERLGLELFKTLCEYQQDSPTIVDIEWLYRVQDKFDFGKPFKEIYEHAITGNPPREEYMRAVEPFLFTEGPYISVIRDLVRQNPYTRYTNYTYTGNDNDCELGNGCCYASGYAGTGTGCIHGQALHIMGVPWEVLKKIDQRKYPVLTQRGISSILQKFTTFSEDAVRWCHYLQTCQDEGRTWGVAMSMADETSGSIKA